MHTYDTESLPARSLHHDPALQPLDDTGAQSLQASYFSRDVIGFDVDVNPAFVADALNLHDRFVGWRLQHAVVAARARVIGIYRTAQCFGPKARGLIDVGVLQSINSAQRREWCMTITLRSDRSFDSSVLRLPAQSEIEVAAAASGRYSEKAAPMQTPLRMAACACEPTSCTQPKRGEQNDAADRETGYQDCVPMTNSLARRVILHAPPPIGNFSARIDQMSSPCILHIGHISEPHQISQSETVAA